MNIRNFLVCISVLGLAAGGFAQETGPAAKTPPAAVHNAAPPAAGAATVPHATDAEIAKLFAAMHMRDNNERFLQSIVPLLDKQAQQMPGFATLDDKDKAYVEQVKQEEVSKLLDPTFVDQLTQLSASAYAEHLSPEDVKSITAFYASPAGTHLREKLPEISKQTMEAAMPVVRARAQEVAADQQKKLSDYMKQKYGTTAPKPDP
ncbi:MAG: DUF2059 domain-containing protein, partial [Acidobacteriaceae bacterium]